MIFGRIKMRLTAVQVGVFLAVRQIWRTSRGISALIIFIMTLTFLNLVVVNGILVGLVQGSSNAYREQYSGDVIISSLADQNAILRSTSVINRAAGLSEVEAVTARLLVPARIEVNYRQKDTRLQKADSRGTQVAGIDPADEDAVTHLADRLIDGEYLDDRKTGEILVGSGLLAAYTEGAPPGQEGLPDVAVGDKVRLVINGTATEFTVRGIVDSKIGQVNQRLYMNRTELRKVAGKADLDVSEIVLVLKDPTDYNSVKKTLLAAGLGSFAKIQTWRDSQGSFFNDIEVTFRALGNVIGGIALVVAALTVFIVVLINALTRKKYIGIMKGIGICGIAIEVSYIVQSLIYAVIGTAFGLVLLYGFIKPRFDVNPIDFPFSDGIIVAPVDEVMLRVVILLVITILAGYLPARYIVSRNTLNTILGR